MPEPQIAHHRGDDGLLGEVPGLVQAEGADRQNSVTVDDAGIGVDGKTTICVPVVSQPEVGSELRDRLLQRTELGRAATVVDVQPIGIVTDGVHGRPRIGVDPRRVPGSRAVRAVDHEGHAVQPSRDRREQMLAIAGRAQYVVTHPAHAGADRTDPPARGLPDHRLDDCFDVIGQLMTAPGEQLDAVVGHGVVTGREHHAQVGTGLAGEEGQARRRDHPTADHVCAGTGQSGDHGRLEHLPAGPRVTADQSHRSVPAARQGKHLGCSNGDGQRDLGRQITVGQATNAVGAEEPTHPLVTSAWSTAAPCGPSSGRTSYVPWPVGHGS